MYFEYDGFAIGAVVTRHELVPLIIVDDPDGGGEAPTLIGDALEAFPVIC